MQIETNSSTSGAEAALRQIMAGYVENNPVSKDEFGAHAARRICAALCKYAWTHPVSDTNDFISDEIHPQAVYEILNAICDELAYGTQTETAIAADIKQAIDRYREYHPEIYS